MGTRQALAASWPQQLEVCNVTAAPWVAITRDKKGTERWRSKAKGWKAGSVWSLLLQCCLKCVVSKQKRLIAFALVALPPWWLQCCGWVDAHQFKLGELELLQQIYRGMSRSPLAHDLHQMLRAATIIASISAVQIGCLRRPWCATLSTDHSSWHWFPMFVFRAEEEHIFHMQWPATKQGLNEGARPQFLFLVHIVMLMEKRPLALCFALACRVSATLFLFSLISFSSFWYVGIFSFCCNPASGCQWWSHSVWAQ